MLVFNLIIIYKKEVVKLGFEPETYLKKEAYAESCGINIYL